MIRIVNKYKHSPTPNDIYIGRGSIFGNPYSHMDGTKALYRVATREEAIEKYREWFHKERLNNPEMYAFLNIMLGKVIDGEDIYLVCYCAPKACHGDVIKEYLEATLAHVSWEIRQPYNRTIGVDEPEPPKI